MKIKNETAQEVPVQEQLERIEKKIKSIQWFNTLVIINLLIISYTITRNLNY